MTITLNRLRDQFLSIKLKKFLAKAPLPFLFKCIFLKRRSFSFRLLLSIKMVFFWLQKFFWWEFASPHNCSIFFLSFLKIFEKPNTVRGGIFGSTNNLTLLRRFKSFLRPFVLTQININSGFLSSTPSISFTKSLTAGCSWKI